jgi:hypothetical protein
VVHGLAINQPAVTLVEIDDPMVADAGIELLDPDAVLHFALSCGRFR